jgi:F-type H+-transporting ATPase subunit epsilon
MLHIEIISSNGNVWNIKGISITLPGKLGTFQVLKNHIPIISLLSKGDIIVKNTIYTKSLEKNNMSKFIVHSGVVRNIDNKLVIIGDITSA